MDVICSSVMKRLIGIFCAAAIGLVAQDTRYPADGSQIPGPGRRATPDWVSELSECIRLNACPTFAVDGRDMFIGDEATHRHLLRSGDRPGGTGYPVSRGWEPDTGYP